MGKIYEKAERVCAWLGEPDMVSIGLLQNLFRRLQILASNVVSIEATSDSNAELQKLGLPAFQDPGWSNLLRFLGRPYFRRIWTLQEIVLAKEPPLVACGLLRFNWYLISVLTAWLFTRRTGTLVRLHSLVFLGEREDGVPKFNLLFLSVDLKIHSNPLYLEYLIEKTLDLHSTDPRDKIIALLGLVS